MFAAIHAIIRTIPRGRVATYGSVAKAAGFPGAARQVVWALRNCKTPLPWHRVVAAGGRIGLPGAQGMDQRLRLQAEGVKFRGAKVDMAQCEFVFAKSKTAKSNTAQAKPANAKKVSKKSPRLDGLGLPNSASRAKRPPRVLHGRRKWCRTGLPWGRNVVR